MPKRLIAIVAVMAAVCGAAQAQVRLAPVPPTQYTPDQQAASAAFEAARKTPVFGPFGMLIRSPNVMTAARQMGDYLRYGSAVGTTLSELAIIITAREWSQDYEWSLHAPIAVRQGIRQDIVDAISAGRRPEGMSADETLVYDFTTELHHNKQVSDATYGKVVARWGEMGVVDLTAINGYYTFLAMALNVARAAPGEGPTLPRFP